MDDKHIATRDNSVQVDGNQERVVDFDIVQADNLWAHATNEDVPTEAVNAEHELEVETTDTSADDIVNADKCNHAEMGVTIEPANTNTFPLTSTSSPISVSCPELLCTSDTERTATTPDSRYNLRMNRSYGR